MDKSRQLTFHFGIDGKFPLWQVPFTEREKHRMPAAEQTAKDEAASAMLAALKLVAKGLRTKHLKDQTLIDTTSDGAEARMFTLSSVVLKALAQAEAADIKSGEG